MRAKLASEAVEMYIRANKWDAAHKVIYFVDISILIVYSDSAKEDELHKVNE